MTDLPAAAITAAAEALKAAKLTYGDVWARRVATEVLEAAAPYITAAERQRIRLGILGCLVCGKIHEPRRTPPRKARTPGGPDWPAGTTYADPDDGHAYRPRHSFVSLGTRTREAVDALLGDAP